MQDRVPGPKTYAEQVAQFRYSVIGGLINQEFQHGELVQELKRLAQRPWRLPWNQQMRVFAVSTIERWFYAYQEEGLTGLLPQKRADYGRARRLTEKQKQLLLDIRDEYPSLSSRMVIKNLVRNGVLEPGALSVSTLNRFYKQHGKPRKSRKRQKREKEGQENERKRWAREYPGELFHSDVCHGEPRKHGDKRVPVRIHALLDDASRFVVALEVHKREREQEMLGMFTDTMLRIGKPGALYTDNGGTYRGEGLESLCGRLEIGLNHPEANDPEARGKMERFWRTMREQCLDHISESVSLEGIQARLNAWLDHDYHVDPHSSLMGASPLSVWSKRERKTKPVSHEELKEASIVTEPRRVKGDSTIQVDGVTYEVNAIFLSKKTVTVGRYLYPLSNDYPPFILFEEKKYPLHKVDPVANSKKRRPEPESPAPRKRTTAPNPADTVLAIACGKLKEKTNAPQPPSVL